ncbi:hypothetical protein ACIU1J_29795 [Azospirillum doebereinerae]|uniref:hypothetical protein n=1 Tax=Azospirillum doebereinerae TaxID=92933 RepID=UPI001EE60307|nr:hypothetical protein [Azospirillum doebereinerae]MCG5240886.1 hypothetical protein [Azospirillum doebereinerae]
MTGERFQEQDALLLDHRRIVAQAQKVLAGPASRAEQLALADDLMTLIDRLHEAKSAMATAIRRGSAARTAASAYGRAGGLRR